MVKCGACGKFLSTTDRACCHKCTAAYHKACVALPTLANVKDSWICPGCKIKIPKSDNTPCKPHTAGNDPACPPPAEDVTHGSAEEPKLDLAVEIRSLRNELKSVRNEVREYRREMQAALGSFDTKLCEFESRLSAIEKKQEQISLPNEKIEEAVSDLKFQLNEREQDLLANDLEITGVPEKKGENLLNLSSILAIKLGVTFDERNIVHLERLGPVRRNRVEGSDGDSEQRSRTIAIRFARRATRDQWVRAARVRRNGQIFARKAEGNGSIYIRTEKDVEKIF
ncbi:hypothetical protein ACJJTC_003639 [Scirpophaga incertulas]